MVIRYIGHTLHCVCLIFERNYVTVFLSIQINLLPNSDANLNLNKKNSFDARLTFHIFASSNFSNTSQIQNGMIKNN